jgi:hypothetical protein
VPFPARSLLSSEAPACKVGPTASTGLFRFNALIGRQFNRSLTIPRYNVASMSISQHGAAGVYLMTAARPAWHQQIDRAATGEAILAQLRR